MKKITKIGRSVGHAIGKPFGYTPHNERRQQAQDQANAVADQAKSTNTQNAMVAETKIEQQQTVVEDVKQQLENVFSVLPQADEKIVMEREACKQHVSSLVSILKLDAPQEIRAAFVNYCAQMDLEAFVFFLNHVPDVFPGLLIGQNMPLMVVDEVLGAEVKKRDAEPVSLAWNGQSHLFSPNSDSVPRVAITRAEIEKKYELSPLSSNLLSSSSGVSNSSSVVSSSLSVPLASRYRLVGALASTSSSSSSSSSTLTETGPEQVPGSSSSSLSSSPSVS